jgi:hypothetical protein
VVEGGNRRLVLIGIHMKYSEALGIGDYKIIHIELWVHEFSKSRVCNHWVICLHYNIEYSELCWVGSCQLQLLLFLVLYLIFIMVGSSYSALYYYGMQYFIFVFSMTCIDCEVFYSFFFHSTIVIGKLFKKNKITKDFTEFSKRWICCI